MKILVDGRIPAKTRCPWRSVCWAANNSSCWHRSEEHDVPFSCAVARAYEVTGMPHDKKVTELRMPFLFRAEGTAWVVKMASQWDLSEQTSESGTMFAPTTLVEGLSWTFAGPSLRTNELAALRKMQELWGSLNFVGV